MVNLQYIFSSFIVPLIVSFLVTVLLLGRVYINKIQPLVDQAQASQDAIDAAVKKAMSAMGNKSAQVRSDGSLEKMVAGDIFKQFPEIEIILGLVSPQTAEAIQEDPARALRLLDRYKEFIPLLQGQGAAETKQIEYDL